MGSADTNFMVQCENYGIVNLNTHSVSLGKCTNEIESPMCYKTHAREVHRHSQHYFGFHTLVGLPNQGSGVLAISRWAVVGWVL